MKKYGDNKLCAYAGTLMSGIGILLLIFFVISIQTERFRKTLYIYTDLLSSQRIYLQTMQRMVLAVVLFSFGMACIFLYYIAYENKIFLNYTRLFWYSSGVVISLWDYETVFHSGQEYLWLWRISGDICLILMSSAVLTIIIRQRDNNGIQFYRFNKVISIGTIFFCVSGNLKVSKFSMIVFLIGYCLLILYFFYFSYKSSVEKVKARRAVIRIIFDWLVLLVQVFIVYLAVFYKYKTLSRWYSIYLNGLAYIVLVYMVLFFTSFFQFQRTGLLLGGETNRKIIEITRHKETITNLLLDQCKIPVNNLLRCKEKYKDTHNDAILKMISREIDSLEKVIDNIRNFNYLYNQRSEGRLIKINLIALLNYSFYILSRNGLKWTGKTDLEKVSGLDYVQGDPSVLIQANEIFMISMMYLCDTMLCQFSVYKNDDRQVRIQFEGEVQPKKYGAARRMQRIISSRSRSMAIRGDEELKLWVARDSLNRGKYPVRCYLRSENRKYLIGIEYKLNIWQEGMEEKSADSMTADFDNGNNKRVILLSTAYEQIEMIRSYLEPENYQILCFNTEEDVLYYLETDHDVGVIIIGTIFYFANLNQFLIKIREKYPIEQLPVVIISDDKYRCVGNELLSYVNDVMTEPFDQIDLLQKVQLLMLLQKSAKEAIRAKLDFLQAQMDPHFIFNTLSTIMPLCLQEPMKCYDVLSDFSQYLRGRLYVNNFQEAVSITREIELIQAYLSIEKVRFADRLFYTIQTDVDESVLILPLLIEPLVENSVKHGIKGNEPLKINISIKDGGDGYVYISVKDNGKGMSEEQLNRIIYDDTKNTGSLGIKNVRKRLMIYYNQILEIHSAENVGTKTSFRIPENSFGQSVTR